MNVAFVNENALGHSSYLPPFVRFFEQHPECGVSPILLNATPLPPELDKTANRRIRGIWRIGLDDFISRWRHVVSAHVLEQVRSLQQTRRLDAVVVNTQSVGLDLTALPDSIRLLVCLDATFAQLSRSPWFAPNAPSRWFLPWMTRSLMEKERLLFQRADQLLAWSDPVAESLHSEYRIPQSCISVLPPSIQLRTPPESPRPAGSRPRILFVGGDFIRKGGPILLEAFRRFLRPRCELHLVTQSPLPPEEGVVVHRGLKAYSQEWLQCWNTADLFVFPSRLETFGIVLVEALAFSVPTISADAGAARMILDEERAGWLLHELTPEALASCVLRLLDDPRGTAQKAAHGLNYVRERFELSANAARLVSLLS